MIECNIPFPTVETTEVIRVASKKDIITEFHSNMNSTYYVTIGYYDDNGLIQIEDIVIDSDNYSLLISRNDRPKKEDLWFIIDKIKSEQISL